MSSKEVSKVDKLRDLKCDIKSLVLSVGGRGRSAAEISQDYEELNGTKLPFDQFGQHTLQTFLESMPDCLTYDNSLRRFYAATDACTKHLESLIQHQKPGKLTRFGGTTCHLSTRSRLGRGWMRGNAARRGRWAPTADRLNSGHPHMNRHPGANNRLTRYRPTSDSSGQTFVGVTEPHLQFQRTPLLDSPSNISDSQYSKSYATSGVRAENYFTPTGATSSGFVPRANLPNTAVISGIRPSCSTVMLPTSCGQIRPPMPFGPVNNRSRPEFTGIPSGTFLTGNTSSNSDAKSLDPSLFVLSHTLSSELESENDCSKGKFAISASSNNSLCNFVPESLQCPASSNSSYDLPIAGKSNLASSAASTSGNSGVSTNSRIDVKSMTFERSPSSCYSDAREECDKADAEREELRSNNKDLVAQVELLNAKIYELTEKLHCLENETADRRTRMSSMSGELAEAKISSSTKDKDILELLKGIEGYKSLMKDLEMDKQMLSERCQSLQRSKQANTDKIQSLLSQLDDSSTALKEMSRVNGLLQICISKATYRRWLDDSQAQSCFCGKVFSCFVRKHHCRNCGSIFCHKCSQNKVQIPSSKKRVRVCDRCYRNIIAMQFASDD